MSQSEMDRYKELFEDFLSEGESRRVTALTDTETNEQVIIPGEVETIESPIQSCHIRVLIKSNGVDEKLVVQHFVPPNIVQEEVEPEENTFKNVFKRAGEMSIEKSCPLLVTVEKDSL